MPQYEHFEVSMLQCKSSSKKSITDEIAKPYYKLSHSSLSIMLQVISNQSQMLPMCELSIIMLMSWPQGVLKTRDIT